MITQTNFINLNHMKEDIKSQNLELYSEDIWKKLENNYGDYPFIFTDTKKVINNFAMIWNANLYHLKKYNQVEKRIYEVLLDEKNFQTNTSQTTTDNDKEATTGTTTITDKGTDKKETIGSDDNSDIEFDMTDDEKGEVPANIISREKLDLDKTNVEALDNNVIYTRAGTALSITSNLANDLKRMINFEFTELPLKFIAAFRKMFVLDIDVDWGNNQVLMTSEEYSDEVLNKIENHIKGNANDGVSVKRNGNDIIISHNYQNNRTLIAKLLQIENLILDKATVAQLQAEIAKLPKTDSYSKPEIDGKINTINNKFDNQLERVNDLYKLFPHNVQIHSDLSSLGIKDSQFTSYSHTDREKFIYNLIFTRFDDRANRPKFEKIDNFTYAYFLELKLDNKTNLSIYWKLALEDRNGDFRLSSLTHEAEIRIAIVIDINGDDVIVISQRNSSRVNWNNTFWYFMTRSGVDKSYSSITRKTPTSSTHNAYKKYFLMFDRPLALDEEDLFTTKDKYNTPMFKTLKEQFLLDIQNRDGKDFDGVIKKFHLILLEEITHHTIRMLLKRDATRIRISSKGNTTDISIPANKQNRWNPAWGLREQKINFTAPNQTGIGWNNATKVATVPAGIYHIFFKHILYDCGIGEKGTQLAFYKENGTTLAVEGVDYILSNDFIQSEKFYDPVSARTRIFKNGGYFQVINPIVLKPQLWWTRSTSRGSGLAHRQAGIAATDQDILSITRLDSGVELENINES